MFRQTKESRMRSTEFEEQRTAPDHSQIETLAYQFWMNRGCPIGSPEDDWVRAEEQLKHSSGPELRAA